MSEEKYYIDLTGENIGYEYKYFKTRSPIIVWKGFVKMLI